MHAPNLTAHSNIDTTVPNSNTDWINEEIMVTSDSKSPFKAADCHLLVVSMFLYFIQMTKIENSFINLIKNLYLCTIIQNKTYIFII